MTMRPPLYTWRPRKEVLGMIGMTTLDADFPVYAYCRLLLAYVSQSEALVAKLKLQKELSWVTTMPVVGAFHVKAAFNIGKDGLQERKNNLKYSVLSKPVPMAAQSKAWICSRLPAEIVGSNPAGGMDVCLL